MTYPLRAVSRARFVGTVLVLYAVCRAITTVILLVVMQDQVPSGMTGGDHVPVTYWSFTALWDGQWYQTIAEHGYPDVLPIDAAGHVQQNPWAFYPLFPLASGAVMALTGLDFAVVGSTIALLCGFGAAMLMGLLLRDRIGDRAALAVVVLWASFPASVALQLAYTESLAVLLLVGYLYALDRRRWLAATGIAVLVGLSRPIGVPLGLVTLVVVIVRWRQRAREPLRAREYAEMAAALAGCAVAGFLWPVIAWWRTGVTSAYTETMGAWRGSGVVEPFTPWAGIATWWLGPTWGPTVLMALPLVIITMVAGPWARALGADLRAWSLGYPLYLAAVLDPFTSIVRYLIPLFPLLLPALGVGWTDRRGTSWQRLLWRAVPLLVLFVIGQYWWTDTLWRFVPPTDFPP